MRFQIQKIEKRYGFTTSASMTKKNPTRPITIFTPSFADDDGTNAQDLTVKEIVARLPSDLFRVVMICSGNPDPDWSTQEYETAALLQAWKCCTTFGAMLSGYT